VLALEILKNCRERGQKRAGGLPLDEAIAELEAMNLTRREWYQKGFNEAMKPKTCLDCKHYSKSTFYGDLKVVKYCHENRLGIGDINFQIFCCNKWEAKDNA
jgi:hypothetical protein